MCSGASAQKAPLHQALSIISVFHLITLSPDTPRSPFMSEQTSESVAETQEPLPPFSFSKKPIRFVYNELGISQILHHQAPGENEPTPKPSLNNINYDEQIRAPRMSLASYYTHLPKARPEMASTDAVNEESKPYEPATFDLNATVRRNLAPLSRNSLLLLLDTYFPVKLQDESSTRSDLSSSEALASDLTVRLDLLKIQRALLNLLENTTSAERVSHSDYAARSAGHRTNGHLVDVRGPSLQHVYSLKKPLCTPAVLRPEPENELEKNADHDTSSPHSEIKEYPLQMPAHDEADDRAASQTMIEPSHDHWKPNSSLDHCTKCFDEFGSFFSPQRKRRHHCRFCGYLYCVKCLYKNREMVLSSSTANSPSKRSGSSSSNSSGYSVFLGSSSPSLASSEHASGVMMDARARLVVPIFCNLRLDPSSFANMRQRFKSCKVCKLCGQSYLKMVQAINMRVEKSQDVSVPYAFIENPYLKNNPEDAASTGALDGSFSSLGSEGPAHFTNNAQERRRSSLTNYVPLDWTWSSF